MVAIADKIGRPSIPSNYAVATTVKTARTAGVTVLETFDLSKYALDTPVFVITYKKTTDPTTGVVSVSNLVSWKALVNADNNTLTNMTLAPGYADTGNAIGDFVECIPTSFWGNSLVDALLTSLNPDGTLKTSAVQLALNITSVPADYTPLATLPNAIVTKGNRSYELTFPAVNYTDRLSPGMRLRTVRSAAAPTQSALLNGTTQYFQDTTVAGMTFTDDFAAGAWVKLSSYATGVIMSRYNGTNGWQFYVSSSGQLTLAGYNGVGVFRQVASYQSIPLNKWVYVSAQLDMSAFTATTTTCYTMIDGVDVPAVVQQGGTPTALVQAGNLEIGSGNAASFFPGKIAQAFVFGAKVTQDTIRNYMSQGISGTEPNLVSAYSLSNSLLDLKVSNANNLTAVGAATTTNADSPFGGQASGLISSTVDYGIIQKVAFGVDTTVTVQAPEGCTIPTIGGLASIGYSTVKAPYGFPSSVEKWVIETFNIASYTISYAATNQWAGSNLNLTIPVGKFTVGYEANVQLNSTVSGPRNGVFTLNSTMLPVVNSNYSHPFVTRLYAEGSGSAIGHVSKTIDLDIPTATSFNLASQIFTASGTEVYAVSPSNTPSRLTAKNAYL